MTRTFWMPACAALLISMAFAAEVPKQDIGRKLYTAKCASCHGQNGKGSPALAMALKASQAELNLTDEESVSEPDEKFIQVTQDGAGKMPAYKKQLSQSEIADIALYVRSLALAKSPAKQAKTEEPSKEPPMAEPAGAPQNARVIIVGGGLAGLVAAYELQNMGITAHILEASERLGGRVATVEYEGGLKGEYGLHEIWTGDPLYEYVKKFNIPLMNANEAESSVYIDGKVYPFVQDSIKKYHETLFTAEELKEYGRWLKECERLYDVLENKGLTPELAELQKISFADWIKSFNLPAKAAEFIRLGTECEMAADWANAGAVYAIQQNRIFLHGSEKCFHAQGGNKKIIEAFAQAVKGPKTLGAVVTRIVRKKKTGGGTEAVVYYQKGGVMRSMQAEKVVLAVPYHMLHAIQMEPSLTQDQWQAVESLTPGMYSVVHFIMDTEANKFLLVDGKNPFPVLTRGPLGVVYGFPEIPPPSQKEEIFSLLIHGDYTRTYLESRDKIRERLLTELDKMWPGFSKYVHGAHFFGYHPAATPGWAPGRSPFDSLHASLRQENVGLYLAGDYIYSSHADGAVKAGREAAKKIGKDLSVP